MQRCTIVKAIMDQMLDDDIVIASTGFISREVYHQKDRPLNFYMMGSMGNALAIGIGIAFHVKHRVFVINGDGSALMSLGTLLTAKSLKLDNLWHMVLDNNCHESTGGQETVSHLVDFKALYPQTFVYKMDKSEDQPPRIPMSPKQITERFRNALQRLNNQQVQFPAV